MSSVLASHLHAVGQTPVASAQMMPVTVFSNIFHSTQKLSLKLHGSSIYLWYKDRWVRFIPQNIRFSAFVSIQLQGAALMPLASDDQAAVVPLTYSIWRFQCTGEDWRKLCVLAQWLLSQGQYGYE